MISVKGGTQTWSKSDQVSSLKSDSAQSLSPKDMEAALGGSALGDVLNKVADPNWVDPVKTRQVGNNQLDKDAFFKLMLTQMKYQDPTNPMQSHEMAAQLAQFTSLEQLNNINSALEGLKNAQAPQSNYQALNFIGKRVWGDSSKITRTAGDKFHDVGFHLNGDASEAKLQIKDGDGNVIRSLSTKNLKKGANSISWNGLLDDGTAARPGEYKVAIEAKGSNGAKIYAKTEFEGRITGLNFSPEGPVLMVGNQSVRMQDVKKISEPSPEEMMLQNMPLTPLGVSGAPNGAMVPGAATPGVVAQPNMAAADIPAASDDGPAQGTGALMKNVAMSRQVMNQVSKDTTNGEG